MLFRFQDVIDEIQDGDFLFFRGKAFYTRVIRRWTCSRYSHVAVAVRIKDRLFVAEAMEGFGVRLYPLEKYVRSGYQVDWFALIDENVDRNRVVQWFIDRIGYQYASRRQLLRSFLTLPLARLFGLSTKVDNDRWFCSFAAIEALNHGYGEAKNTSAVPSLASPGDVSYETALHIRGTLVWEDSINESNA
ncbi:YiiX/YebB-like N1pC/P60 family cysteine hydrolase [Rubinisphaera sp.]|uniref:YiiX/YebB-like N1pC/P60 family cysteine hydrolase n=1 Tax=Rubinisphaera sp. TaxID=2024857 RepID=UPI000C0EB2C2|nr:YiiX/YebB-like N1pC/P60 family cysteine hydrolase [Rubinisphaera sp.]MBV07667.1 hypothetical protein [Rubinisphaera sp.]HCS53272.1 hypothetical protein [Planctomycetaceae bacterium]|tara:strand:- start:691 stop:1260 length:570 start_codon:yes stop_codon:yes gene_type:complete